VSKTVEQAKQESHRQSVLLDALTGYHDSDVDSVPGDPPDLIRFPPFLPDSHMLPRCYAILFLVAVISVSATADDEKLTEGQQQLFHHAAEVLRENCLRCHSGASPKGELDLTTREGILAGGQQGGNAFDPDDPGSSTLLLAIQYEGFEMPPTGQMSPKKIGILEKWLSQGMPWPSDHKRIEYEAEAGPPPVNEETKSFWSFQPVAESAVPASDWGHNAIDAFIADRLRSEELSPSPPADASKLVRRMHYNVTGLPPEPEFVSEWSARLQEPEGTINPEAVAELIEVLLESPRYGEHWGRHWLDLVRYAETNSYERDGAKPFVWRYRDYVIRAFNSDKPYDRFLTEQLAGDELQPTTADSVIATGYYRLGRWDDEPADPALAFYDDVDDIITTTSQTMLGLTVNCARCHDHKIDPIPQRDYYRIVGFFRHLRRYGVRSDQSVADASIREVNLAEDEGILERELKDHERQLQDTNRLMAEFEKTVLPLLSEPQREDFQFEKSRLSIVGKLKDNGLSQAQIDHYQNLTRRQEQLVDNRPSGRAKVLCVTEDVSSIQPTHILTRGSPHALGAEVTAGFPEVLSPPEVQIPEPAEGSQTSGRRSVLAAWVASPDNPLTARVMVNRIWQHHFGRGIVRSASDFGFQGTRPTHPLLLDWLASQFVQNGWSIKYMHRLIMSSAVYQMSSAGREDALAIDPVNDMFWRYDMRRLTAEEVRDSILWATGSLNATKMYGPSVYTDIPDEVKAGQSRPGSGWGKSLPEDENRRSIYIHVKRSLLDPLLESFDFADTDQTCPVRFVTTQPTQALSMLNSRFLLKEAEIFAARAQQEESKTAQVRSVLTRVMQRQPTDQEIKEGVDLMVRLQAEEGLSEEKALQYFCLVALNLNEFIYLD
jgi:hypothetical protein